ncbi:MAG: hypothetical protein A4E55_02358 [Pelotomaculum sp. PtaU1.Bin035]|nr:MAG: hypothetical protein A4E55_02358 [Pelotomaculum sp. PtaU1.Bin035]
MCKITAYIVHHSQILIALWNGVETGNPGGTSDVVNFKLKGVPERLIPQQSILYPADIGPVHHIVTPRRGQPEPQNGALELVIKPDQQAKVKIDRILEQINEFNRVSKVNHSKIKEQIDISKKQLIPDEDASKLSSAGQTIRECYALADALALHYQKRRQSTLNSLFFLAGMAIIAFEFYAHLFREIFWLLIFYPAFLAIAYFLYRLVKNKKRDFQNKFLDYRALAEGMRVQLFWRIAGLKNEVADHYLYKQRNELRWIRKAVRNWNLLAGDDKQGDNNKYSTSGQRFHNYITMVLNYWVNDQYKFFNSRVGKNHLKIKKHKLIIETLFIAGVSIASFVVIIDIVNCLFNVELIKGITYNASHSQEDGFFRHLLIVCMGLLPAAAATLEGYDEKMAYSEQTKQYERMKDVFEGAKREFEKSLAEQNCSDASEIAFELGTEALSENGDWVLMYRERPLTAPIPKK